MGMLSLSSILFVVLQLLLLGITVVDSKVHHLMRESSNLQANFQKCFLQCLVDFVK
jgi:hypothetical protein